jgi:hypothetical protein
VKRGAARSPAFSALVEDVRRRASMRTETVAWCEFARDDTGRDVLNGRDVHCGDVLEVKPSPDWTANPIKARYERAGARVVLVIDDYTTLAHSPGMRFRWPT